MALFYYLFPLLFYIVLLVPTFLLFDFGVYFSAYLRGGSSTPSFAMELLYDYIAIAAFYVRLIVQGVRLLLMAFVYGSLNEFILNMQLNLFLAPMQELIFEEYYATGVFFKTTSYYLLIKLPAIFIYWLYEFFHTVFVLSVQFIAFFAMVFWLFMFLYTMFYYEPQENYFSERRFIRENIKKKFTK